MRPRLGHVTCNRTAQRLGVRFAHLSQSETCISGNGKKQRHEREHEQPAQQQQDLKA